MLSGLDVDPGKAESLRSSIVLELHKALAGGGLVEGMAAGAVSRISVPAVKASDLGSEAQIAGNLARSVQSAIDGTKVYYIGSAEGHEYPDL